MKNKGKLTNLPYINLLKKEYNFKSTNNTEYNYEVNFIVIKKIRNNHLVINNEEFKNFVLQEYEKEKNKVYDNNSNIRDLYSIDIHTDGKQQEDIKRFNNLNDYIMKLDSRISRRVTKKDIVYKKNKSKSIISIKICKRSGLKIFILNTIAAYGTRFVTISRGNGKPLEKMMKIKNKEDLNYVKKVIEKYVKEIF